MTSSVAARNCLKDASACSASSAAMRPAWSRSTRSRARSTPAPRPPSSRRRRDRPRAPQEGPLRRHRHGLPHAHHGRRHVHPQVLFAGVRAKTGGVARDGGPSSRFLAASSHGSQRVFMTVIHHVRVTGTAGGVWIGETGELVLTVHAYMKVVGKGLTTLKTGPSGSVHRHSAQTRHGVVVLADDQGRGRGV